MSHHQLIPNDRIKRIEIDDSAAERAHNVLENCLQSKGVEVEKVNISEDRSKYRKDWQNIKDTEKKLENDLAQIGARNPSEQFSVSRKALIVLGVQEQTLTEKAYLIEQIMQQLKKNLSLVPTRREVLFTKAQKNQIKEIQELLQSHSQEINVLASMAKEKIDKVVQFLDKTHPNAMKQLGMETLYQEMQLAEDSFFSKLFKVKETPILSPKEHESFKAFFKQKEEEKAQYEEKQKMLKNPLYTQESLGNKIQKSREDKVNNKPYNPLRRPE